MSTRTDHFTADELLRLPDNGLRRELVAGELRQMTPSGHEHGRVAMRLSAVIAAFVEEHDLGAVYAAATGFLLARDPDTVRAPDFAFVSRRRLAAVVSERGYFPGAPDLAVEVVSPGDTDAEIDAKVRQWLDAGCQIVLVATPRDRSLRVHRPGAPVAVLAAADTFDGDEVLPGLRLPVRQIFPA